MNILISNDDGINSDGIRILAEEVSKIADVYVVAPDSQRSATSHAITLHKPVLVNEEYICENVKAYSTSGTPADCVKIGIEAILNDIDIDLVLSGINNGPNLGDDVIYSGTVSAAIEGMICKKPSIALSYNSHKVTKEEFREASKCTALLIKKLKDYLDKLDDVILNVNFPVGDKKGVKITKLGKREYTNVMDSRENARGQRYVWMCGDLVDNEQDEDSDIFAVENGYISITPLHVNMTDFNKIETLKDLEDINL